jgi:uncharacterized protein
MTTARDWQQSFSGKVITPRELRVEQVTFDDIGHALAQKTRFAGQCTVMGYSVAQHCVIGAAVLNRTSRQLALAFLLHEVSEVYLPDVPSPLKKHLYVTLSDLTEMTTSWAQLEKQHADVIFEALKLPKIRPLVDSPEVKLTDVRMLLTEKRDLMGPEPQPWGFTEQPFKFKIVDIWEPAYAEKRFNQMFGLLAAPGGGYWASPGILGEPV